MRSDALLEWSTLPDLRRPIAGQLVGNCGGTLLVLGGSFFPTPFFEGGKKTWTDEVWALPPDGKQWKAITKLKKPLGYGATVSHQQSLVCIGGGGPESNYTEVFEIRLVGEEASISALPDLPRPLANHSAVILDDVIYLAGGQHSPSDNQAAHVFWALDLSRTVRQWEQLKPWPGPGRILPVMVAQDSAVYLFSGAELQRAGDGKVQRRYLTDAYRYAKGQGWKRTAELPRPAVAAPAVALGQSHIGVLGGDDGQNAQRIWELKDSHPGFCLDILAYHTITDTWSSLGKLPKGLVTTGVVQWNGLMVIPGGEDRPGHRSSEVHAAKMRHQQGAFGALDYAVLGAYFLVMLLIGLHFTGQTTTKEFFLAEHSIPWWAAGLSIYGTQLSALTFMAIPAKAYATDWVYILVNACIVVIAPFVIHYYLPFFCRLHVTTAYEFLEKRFNLAVRLFGSLTFILLQMGRLSIVIFLPAIALATVTNLSAPASIILMGLFVTVYATLGGVKAVVWTDVLQVIVLLGGALVCLSYLVAGVDGGLPVVLRTAAANGKFHFVTWSWSHTTTAIWVVLIGNLFAQLVPYTTDQAVVQRYLTTRDEKAAARSIWSNALLTIPTSLLFFGIGTALYVFYKSWPERLNPALPTDAILPWFVAEELPQGMTGLIVAAVFAAAMSTLSGGINSVATAIVTDFYGRLSRNSTEKSRFRLARRLTVALGLLGTGTALVMAMFPIRSIWDVFLQILGLFGGPIAGVFALGVFTKRANGRGTLVGALTSAIVLLLIQRQTGFHFFLYAPIGVLTCVSVGYLSSLLFFGGRADGNRVSLLVEPGLEEMEPAPSDARP